MAPHVSRHGTDWRGYGAKGGDGFLEKCSEGQVSRGRLETLLTGVSTCKSALAMLGNRLVFAGLCKGAVGDDFKAQSRF